VPPYPAARTPACGAEHQAFDADAIVETLAALERTGGLSAAVRLLASQALSPDRLTTIAVSLYRSGANAVPFVIATKLVEGGVESLVLRALVAHLAVRLGQPAAAGSIIQFAQRCRNADGSERDTVRALLDPLLPIDLVEAFRAGNLALIRSYTPLWGALDPETLERLAPPPAGYVPNFARFQNPALRLPQRDFPAIPADALHRTRKVVFAIRHRWVPDRPSSREHDMPSRYSSAIGNYGWSPIRHDLRSFNDAAIVTEDYQAISALCRESGADLLILDEFLPRWGTGAAGEIIRALRRDRPSLKILSIYFDPWNPQSWDEMEAAAAYLDGAWSQIVTPVWQRPAFRHKAFLFPFPLGGIDAAPRSREPGFRFAGGVEYTNWDRALWLAAISATELPLDIAVSAHRDDDLTPIESFRVYLQRVCGAEAAINFARRSNGLRTSTARIFEVLAGGGLLVQERSDDLDFYLSAGEHYLRFETLTDLFDIAELIRSEPGFVNGIRHAGAAFFRAHYADDRLFAYLDRFLFDRESVASAAA
jgi:hypothetical protein